VNEQAEGGVRLIHCTLFNVVCLTLSETFFVTVVTVCETNPSVDSVTLTKGLTNDVQKQQRTPAARTTKESAQAKQPMRHDLV
jgi:hypothetical protein